MRFHFAEVLAMSQHVRFVQKRESHQQTAWLRSARAFTLVELLVVIGIIAVLIGVLLPALGKARKQGYRVQCETNQHQLVLPLVMYAQNFKGYLPDSVPVANPYG